MTPRAGAASSSLMLRDSPSARLLRTLAILLFVAVPLRAQVTSPVAEAERLRAQRRFADAVAVLQPWVARHPEDVGAATILGETQYWNSDVAGARSTFQSALDRHPDDRRLRLVFGRLLVDVVDGAAARRVLGPLERDAEAAELLGKLAWWTGDLRTARRLLRDASQDPGRSEARDMLQAIALATSPWVSLTGTSSYDTQVLIGGGSIVAAGWYPEPGTRIEVRAHPMVFVSDDVVENRQQGEVRAVVQGAGGRLELRGAAGAANSGFIGSGGASLKLAAHAAVHVDYALAPYWRTLASFDTAVRNTATTARLTLDHPSGWMAEAGVQRQGFPRGDEIRTSWGWILAPLLRWPKGLVQAGYAISYDDADSSRFVVAGPVGAVGTQVAGAYDPWFTPEQQQIHRVAAVLTLRPRRGVVARVDGSYGVSARDVAPGFIVTGVGQGNAPSQVTPTWSTRDFAPWSARAQLEVNAGGRWEWRLGGESMHTVFYTGHQVQVSLIKRFP